MKSVSLFLSVVLFIGCGQPKTDDSSNASADTPVEGGQSNVKDDVSQQDVVKIAVNSKDHSTLVAALKAAEYVDALSNAGPFTVFAPTNAAFDKLPKGTLETLTKPENKEKLRTILEYHVFVGVLNENMMRDGMTINQVSLDNATLKSKDGKWTINNANILGSARASNGIVYIIDEVLIPPDKK